MGTSRHWDWRELARLSIVSVCLVLLAGCGALAPSSTATPSPTAVILPPSASATSTRLPRPPADLTNTPAPPKIRRLQLNQTIDAIYSPGESREDYVFGSERARWVEIELVPRDDKGDLRLVVQVYDAADDLIPKASAPIGQPSLRDVWNIPKPGMYRIRIFGTETESRAFDLRISSVPIPEIGGGSIACNEAHSGEIAVRGQRDQWVFGGEVGDQITISMLAPGNDGILELYAPGGELIAHSDGVTQASTGTILDITLSIDGDYAIVARMYGDAQAGIYRLSLMCND